MKTLVQEKIKVTGVLNVGKADFRSFTACEADK